MKYVIGALIPVLILGLIIVSRPVKKVSAKNNLTRFSASDLIQYDGTNPDRPIYIALNGFVYDVTKGKKFYVPGGPYHDLAGKDSSIELNKFGGKIIEHKYPVVGVFISK